MLDCDIVEIAVKLQSRYYVHFPNNNLRKSLNPIVPPAMEVGR